MPKCTVIKTGATVVRTTSERVEELKEVIKNIKVPLVGEVGDAVLYDNQALTFVMVKPENISAEDYPLSRYTPIGVVAIPTSHNVYGTGECGVVSLMEMDYNAPDKGTTSWVPMYWGQYNTDTALPNLDKAVQTGTTKEPTSEATGNAGSSVDLPSDSWESSSVCPTDPEAFYLDDEDEGIAAGPSPYLADGNRNPVYYQTTEPTSEANCLADFDGVGNTKVLCDLATAQEDWKTAETIDHQYAAGYSPAACCCWRFHTDGTKQGDWYLPAEGELGYMGVRAKKLNNTIKAITDAYGSDMGRQLMIDGYWSSSEYSSGYARALYMFSVLANNKYDGSHHAARAFLRV